MNGHGRFALIVCKHVNSKCRKCHDLKCATIQNIPRSMFACINFHTHTHTHRTSPKVISGTLNASILTWFVFSQVTAGSTSEMSYTYTHTCTIHALYIHAYMHYTCVLSTVIFKWNPGRHTYCRHCPGILWIPSRSCFLHVHLTI